MASSPTELLPMGVASKCKLWQRGTELKIRFLEGAPELQERTLRTGASWIVDGVKLKMRLVQPGEKADIRIAFNPNSGSWSYVGTDCRDVHPSQSTMNLGWASLDTPEADFSSVVIHEFGHALGLLNEHFHPGAMIYAAPPHWTIDGKGCVPSWKLSPGDAATIKMLYG